MTRAEILPAVIEQAEVIRKRGKTRILPAAVDMPSVEIIKLDGTREAGDRQVQHAMLQASRSFAWLAVTACLADLANDPRVLRSPGHCGVRRYSA